MQGETFDYKGTSVTQMTTESFGLNGMHTGSYQVVTPWTAQDFAMTDYLSNLCIAFHWCPKEYTKTQRKSRGLQ